MIARGRTAEIFEWKDSQILKVYLEGFPSANVGREAQTSMAVHKAGLPVPAMEGIVEVDGRLGIVFERIEGPSMLAVLISKPWQIFRLARMLAELLTQMHSCEIPELPSQRDMLEGDIRRSAVLPTPTKEAALKALEQLPGDNAVCHGDFHPDNIIMSTRGPIIIDWMTATQGNPLADVARTWMLLRLAEVPSFIGGRWLIEAIRNLFYAIYLRRYRQLRPVSQEEMEAWQLPVMAARLRENIPEEEQRLLALVEASLKQRKS